MDNIISSYHPFQGEFLSPYEAMQIGENETDTTMSEEEVALLFEDSFNDTDESHFTPYEELEASTDHSLYDYTEEEASQMPLFTEEGELEVEGEAEEFLDFEEENFHNDMEYEFQELEKHDAWEEQETATDLFIPTEVEYHLNESLYDGPEEWEDEYDESEGDFGFEEMEEEFYDEAEAEPDFIVPQSGSLENEAQYLFEDFWSNLSRLWRSKSQKPAPSTNYWTAFAKRAACIAEKEWKAWGKGSIHETNPRFQSKLRAYFSSTQLNSTRVEKSTKSNLRRGKGSPWSAAFISYVMKKAGAGEYFHYNSSHLNYILAAKKNKRRGIKNPFQLFELHKAKPQVGDLVCNSRGCFSKSYHNIDRAKSTRCGDSKYAATYSHCDIIVEVDESNNRVWVIGGNTGNNKRAFGGHGSNTVGKKSRRLNASGQLIAENGIFALLKVRTDLNIPAPTQNAVFSDCSSPSSKENLPIAPSKPRHTNNAANPLGLTSQFISRLSSLLNQGLISMSVFLAFISGNRNANQLTDMLFHSRHPELNGRKLKKSDRALIQEWNSIKRDLILPLVTSSQTSPTSTPKQSSPQTKVPANKGFLNRLKPYHHIIEAKARKYKLNPNIIRAIIAAESNGDPNKTSVANYKGLMQAGKEISHYTPAISIEAGAKKFAEFRQTVISNFKKRSGINLASAPERAILRLTLASYNAGPVTVIKALEYAQQAGDWKNWLDKEHYQRALIFSGGYHTYEKCHRGASRQAIKEAVNAKWKFAGWRKSSVNWRDFQDPPLFAQIQMPSIMRCWVNTKHQNTIPYLQRFEKHL